MVEVLVILLIGLTPNGENAPYTASVAPYDSYEECVAAKAVAEAKDAKTQFYCATNVRK